MFQKGEYVACGNKGVCVVEDVAALDISGVDKERLYYILKPVYSSGSTVYVPVSSADESMRSVLSDEAARQLLKELSLLPLIVVSNDKLFEQEYRSRIKTNDCMEWAKVLKTVCYRKKERLAAGRKQTAVDAKYFRIAGDNLYGELAVALGMGKNEAEDCFMKKIEEEMRSFL